MEKLAELVKDWDVDPGLVIEAAFAQARRNKHPDGPLPNMMLSVKWLSKALSLHLELPWEVIAEKRSSSVLIEKLDEEYEKMLPEMLRCGDDIHMMNSYPVEFRFVVVATRTFNRFSMKQMAPSLLALMAGNRKVCVWLESKGLTYGGIAKAFNANN